MRSSLSGPALWLSVALTASTCLLLAQDDKRGRKYTAPPPVAHVVVTVTKGVNDKPVESASVIFHTFHNGKDQGNGEVKTNEEGRAVIDVIPIGDTIRLQVIKSGYRTFGEDYELDTPTKEIAVKMKPPTRQYSIYEKHADDAQPDSAPKANDSPKSSTPPQ